jgi:hypothetical protein
VGFLPENSVLERILKRALTSTGSVQGNREKRLKYRHEILKILAEHVNGFKQGLYSTVYFPLVYPLDYFEYFLMPVIVGETRGKREPRNIYEDITSLLRELQNLRDPYRHQSHKEATLKCIEVSKHYENKVYAFVDKYLAINRTTLINIASIILEQPDIKGSIDAIYRLISEENYMEILRTCKDIQVGGSKYDTIKHRLYGLARTYDALLIMLGAGYHFDPSERDRVSLKRRPGLESHDLRRTMFTQAFIYVMLGNYPVESYVQAYKSFVECVVKLYREPIEHTSRLCSEELNKWKTIGLETSLDMVREISRVLYALIDEALNVSGRLV